MNGHQPYSAQSKSLASQEIEMAYLPISSSSISIDSNRTKNSQELYSRNPNSSYTTSFSTESDLIIQLQLLDATIDNIKVQCENHCHANRTSITWKYHTSFCVRQYKSYLAIIAGITLEVCFFFCYIHFAYGVTDSKTR